MQLGFGYEAYCRTCKTYKPVEDMTKNRNLPGGITTSCKPCSAARTKKYYTDNREKRAAQLKKSTKARRDARSEWLRDLKGLTPCVDCGKTYHYCQMDLDHRPGEEKHAVLQARPQMGFWNFFRERSLADVEAEIAKCDVVCSNCHRMRTFTRRHRP